MVLKVSQILLANQNRGRWKSIFRTQYDDPLEANEDKTSLNFLSDHVFGLVTQGVNSFEWWVSQLGL